ncbi:hypothetical protein T4D_16416 [Trichinella pseudospiralis]|uniref:Uncharacterized protein n=1 Tax=Trichinella pseudospiralis TaxID=6337 RepID=A0A0V1FPF2_TRIPS|nr:hypothetical protein T4D_16416 [Trichinella pseudospiralis]
MSLTINLFHKQRKTSLLAFLFLTIITFDTTKRVLENFKCFSMKQITNGRKVFEKMTFSKFFRIRKFYILNSIVHLI